MSRSLAHVLFWVSAAACVAAELAILRAALASNQTSSPPTGDVPQPARAGEIIWVVIPAIAMAALLWATWRALP